ncbi:MAG: hypothetical protein HZC02_04970 [Candidatus Levybacteria bacterium]|nr:hypothetical protein [Candidatus Levybacteria bacterium]
MALNLPFSASEKKRIEDLLADRIILALQQGEILEEVAIDAASFIRPQLETIQDRNQLVAFLQELTSRWSFFASVYQDEKKVELIGKIETELSQMSANQR